jgi:uncharacterized protein YbaP (TraB family)
MLTVSVSAQEMFWEVNGTKGGKVYILGSLEMGNRDMYPLNQHVIDAFSRSNYLILAMGRGASNEAFIQDQLYVKARYDDNDSLQNHLTSESYQALGLWLKDHKISADRMDRFPPWVVGLTLTELDMALRGDEQRFTLENYFYQKARRVPKGVYGIERISDAFMRLKDSDDMFQQRLLEAMIDLRVATQQEAKERFSMYQEGNRTYFEEKLIKPFDAYSTIQERVLYDKTETYFKKIMRYRANKRGRHYFVIINLQNLLGEKGVLARLKEADVEVTAY